MRCDMVCDTFWVAAAMCETAQLVRADKSLLGTFDVSICNTDTCAANLRVIKLWASWGQTHANSR